ASRPELPSFNGCQRIERQSDSILPHPATRLTIILVYRALCRREFLCDHKKPGLADRQRYPFPVGWARSLELSVPFLCFNSAASRCICLCKRLDLSISRHLWQRRRPPRLQCTLCSDPNRRGGSST